jgi:nitrogen-specific signal transduction histidine kinase
MERNLLLIEIENAYIGELYMQNGIPASKEDGHGYGCRSVFTIAQKRNGFCTFQVDDGIFTLRVVLPTKKE